MLQSIPNSDLIAGLCVRRWVRASIQWFDCCPSKDILYRVAAWGHGSCARFFHSVIIKSQTAQKKLGEKLVPANK